MLEAGVEVNWEEEMFKCFKDYHVTSTNAKHFENLTGMTKKVADWFG
ncbi:hypothetical protein [Xenorhabdus cabanillasii]|nr:hypothetical protein [Xenorhabdus cabanillasii]PHM75474.1 hypothetical protein Xcab_04034 [Xenorhabdus cabanillasii JM26]CDL82458.1 hypothetical protein XCR1_1660014 [Xenorhabdus cabanillasii JM26]